MSDKFHPVKALLLAVVITLSVLGAACAHHEYRVYDPYYSDYHVWNDSEIGYYHQWANETHRDPNRDFRHIPPEEQKEYWNWRHSHGSNDHH